MRAAMLRARGQPMRSRIDGRNRLKACELAGVKPRFIDAGKVDSPTAYVISANLQRRHLNRAQRAAAAAEAEPLFAKEAKARQVEAGKAQGRISSSSLTMACRSPCSLMSSASARSSASAIIGKIFAAACALMLAPLLEHAHRSQPAARRRGAVGDE
jgi:hypothetical protein